MCDMCIARDTGHVITQQLGQVLTVQTKREVRWLDRPSSVFCVFIDRIGVEVHKKERGQ